MAGSFDGKLVLITGASAGIGRAAVKAFAADGARVLATARRREKLIELAAEVERDGGKVEPFAADVADGPSMTAMSAAVLARFGSPDVLIANAGVGLDARFVESTDEAVRTVFETNVLGVYRSVRPFLPGMVARGSGRVLLVSSVVGLRGTPHYSAYSASKFALHGMVDSLRAELYGSGVTVGIVCPSSTGTEFQEAILREGPSQNRVRAKTHTPESVADVLVRMARSKRRRYVCSAEGRLMLVINAVAPGFLDGLLHRILMRPARP